MPFLYQCLIYSNNKYVQKKPFKKQLTLAIVDQEKPSLEKLIQTY